MPSQRLILSLLFFASTLTAQTDSFPKRDYFRQTFQRPQTQVELLAPVKLNDAVVEGPAGRQLELSMRAFLELVMANNTDVAIQRLQVDLYKDAITRAFAIFDPIATGRWTSNKQKTPVTSVLDSLGTTSNLTLANLTQPANFTYSQVLPTGTQINASFLGQKVSTTSFNSLYNPLITSNLGVTVTQPLLKNAGYFINRIPVMVARSRLRQNEFTMKNNIINLVQNAENAYWDVVLARDNLRVQEEALRLATQALQRAQQELDLGAMSPLDIYNPQQNRATAEIAVSQARFTLAQREDALRRQIGADMNPDIRSLPIRLTETVDMAIEPAPIDVTAAVNRAMAERNDLKAARQSLDVDDLSIKGAANQLRPDFSLLGSYAAYGRGGNFLLSTAGFGQSLSDVFSLSYPTYMFGVQLRLPIRNHQASADYADTLVQKKLDALNIRGVEQQIRLDILNAASQVESAQASVRLAKTALDFSHKYLDAEQRKYELGTSTIYFVLQAQQALINADSALVQNTVSYRRFLMNLAARTGTLLEDRGIALQ